MHNQDVYITAEALQKIKDELVQLQTERLPEIVEKLEFVISEGDITESTEYDALRAERAFVEARMIEIEDTLRYAKVVDDDVPSDVVRVGSTVTVMEAGFDEEETYQIVGVHGAEVSSGRISNESPIGRALMGAKVGDTVVAQTPGGALELKVVRIS
ncbi:MAG: transcription elongation factor GreA [Anaerolineae bacterium]|nr:transcription elongation factor GreA [Anaerolineae bacterium]MCO5194592.1 transcription elongation factor GreA [Anaerolineae bacterium]MCO5199217.1 transcription elongation factor GreA [Anaerolineae bacterium]MCO5206431.1 transcription elongation factor GreA [Anaerolineae bacterium]